MANHTEWPREGFPGYVDGGENDDIAELGLPGFAEAVAGGAGTDVLLYGDSAASEPLSARAIIDDDGSDKIWAAFGCGEAGPGELIYFNGGFWLVSDRVAAGKLHDRAHLVRCNTTLTAGSTAAQPCAAENSTDYNRGVSRGSVMTVGRTHYVALVPASEANLAIARGDTARVDGRRFTVTQTDTSLSGLVRLNLDELAESAVI